MVLIDTNPVLFNIRDVNKGLFAFFLIVYYLLPGVLRCLCIKSKNRKELYFYLFLGDYFRFRIGFAMAAATLTIAALGAYTVT